MDGPFEIRICTREDLSPLSERLPSSANERRFQLQEEGRGTYLIAWLGRDPVGNAFIRWQGASEKEVRSRVGDCPNVEGMNVRRDLRSCGIGSELLAEAERLVRQRGHSRIGLGVGVGNARARRLYERMGYRDWGQGRYEASWPEARENGVEQWRSETCHYLVKQLVRAG